MANTRRGDLGSTGNEEELESADLSGQTGGDRRWEQVGKRVDGVPEAEGKIPDGAQPSSGQSLGSARTAKRDGEEK